MASRAREVRPRDEPAVGGRHFAAELIRRGRKLLRLLSNPRFRSGLRHGVAATIEHAGALAGRDFASVVDVGANHGQFTLFAAGLYPKARIFGFRAAARALCGARAHRGRP